MNPKILIIAPTSIYKDYILLEWYLWISSLTYKNYDILICDNSLDTSYYQKLKAMDMPVIHCSPIGKTPREYIADSLNQLRNHFLKGDYEVMVIVEVDVFPPRNFTEKLLCENKDMISAPFFYDFGPKSNILLWYFAQTGILNEHDKPIFTTHKADFMQGLNFMDGEVNQIYQSGIGCTMLKRKVVEKIPFRWEHGKPEFPDSFLYADALKAPFFNYMDTSFLCKHYNSDWSQNPDHGSFK
jgi:hypothetical protein